MKISDFPFKYDKRPIPKLQKHFGEDLFVVNTEFQSRLPITSPEERALRKEFKEKGYLIFDSPCNLSEQSFANTAEIHPPCHIIYKKDNPS